MLVLDLLKGELNSPDLKMTFADGPYCYRLSGLKGDNLFNVSEISVKNFEKTECGETTLEGTFNAVGIEIYHKFKQQGDGLEESITLKNCSDCKIKIKKLELGFSSQLENKMDWELKAIPFRTQLDGNVHEYSGDTLLNGTFTNFINGCKPEKGKKVYGNSVYSDATRPEPDLTEDGVLRSEAWAWGKDGSGLAVIKYNNDEIELSVAAPDKETGSAFLRFGGAGLCLYGEPSGVGCLEPGSSYTFGSTIYKTYTAGVENAYYIYRSFLEGKGHTFPQKYNPPVNWNELYDIGWYHSDKEKLKEFYTKEAILLEAAKAKECYCDLLYMDPGWELAEGVTLWDDERLGNVEELINILKKNYEISFGYRTILRCYINYWSDKLLVRHNMHEEAKACTTAEQYPLWEVCLCNDEFWKEKLKRILDISSHDVQFMMFDEMDWRGPCYNDTHGHSIPSKPIDHVMAVYKLSKEVRKQCPGLLTEVHDPVWPWAHSIYVPTYFKQGFEDRGYYDENWGFEFMWDCLNDLKSGKALSLYYYNLGCSIPLYLHITMAADNDQCLFFWWCASTVRHLGIGGKESNPTIEPQGKLPLYDKVKRFEAYKKSMKYYKALKRYFACGVFTGITENVHLHSLTDSKGGVVNVFNVSDEQRKVSFFIDSGVLGGTGLKVHGANEVEWTKEGGRINVILSPMSHALVSIGEAAEIVEKVCHLPCQG